LALAFAAAAEQMSQMPAAVPATLNQRFQTAMHRLEPFEPAPRLAVAGSGGAGSMALSPLAARLALPRGGTLLARAGGHGLGARSGEEADLTLRRLTEVGIDGHKLVATELRRGPALAERAREVRYRLLLEACAAAGIAHLLVAHHRADQVETVMMRVLSGS